MNRILKALFFVAALAGLSPADAEPLFSIAPPPLGSDAHDGSAQAPFATLDRARLAVRAYLAAHDLRNDLVVELRAGTYALSAPVRFEPADSGKNGFDVVYRAAPAASVVLSGGHRVTGWTRESEGLYRAEVGTGADFRQLWIDGRRAVRARTPNVGRMFTLASEKQADGFDLPTQLLAGLALRPGEVEMSVLIAWMHKRLRIARTSESNQSGMTRAVIESPEWDGITRQPQGDRNYLGRSYWLENAREFLDAPGEFYLDRTAGVLRYRPCDGEDLSRAEVIRPDIESLIVLDGQLDSPVHHLRFEGLTLAHTGWTRPNRYGFVDVQANSLIPASPADAVDSQYRHNQRKDRIPAAFQAATADHVVIRGCGFARLGGTGVMFTRGGNDNVIEGNSFIDVAAGGIELGEDAAQPTDPRLFPRRNRIANNFLARLGQDYFGSVAILGYYTDASLITHNDIAAIPYTGISQGWGWDKPRSPDDSRANRIMHNRVSNYMRRLDDGGGIYTTGRQPGSEIADNYVAYMLPPNRHTKAGGALYPDQCTEGFHLHHNVIVDAVRWLNIWNPNIRNNRVDSNFANTAAQRNDGTDNVVEPVHLVTDARWPDPAQAIIEAAGLEPNFAGALELAAPSEVRVESTDLEFAIVSGSWKTTDAPAGRHGAYCRQSTDADAAARWSPILPKTGRYAVSVWQPAGSAAARFVIRRPDGFDNVSISATTEAGWVNLGEFTFSAGATVEIEVRPASAKSDDPLTADVLRCSYSGRVPAAGAP
jgi:hypothetical protein